MDFKQFEYVLAVAEEKSFSKAAKKLYISQPSLSQYINRIETNLGVVLFDRTTTPLTLTYEGEIYRDTALNILNLLEKMRQKYDDINNLELGKLNIGLTPSKANSLLPLILPCFKKKYPKIELTLTEASSLILEDLISKDLVDICLMNLPIKSSCIEYKPILTEKILIAAPISFKYTNDCADDMFPKINIKDIKNEQFILLRPGQRIRQISDTVFSNAGFKPNILLETGSIETSMRLSAAGMGFSFVPESSAVLSVSSNLKYFTLGNPPLTWTTVVAYRQNTHHTKAAYAFINIAKETSKN